MKEINSLKFESNEENDEDEIKDLKKGLIGDTILFHDNENENKNEINNDGNGGY